MEHGKSRTASNEFGSRRKALDMYGNMHVLAPRHFRKMGRHYMDDVSDEEIGTVYFNFDFKALKRSIASHKGMETKCIAKGDAIGAAMQQEKIKMIESELSGMLARVAQFRNA